MRRGEAEDGSPLSYAIIFVLAFILGLSIGSGLANLSQVGGPLHNVLENWHKYPVVHNDQG